MWPQPNRTSASKLGSSQSFPWFRRRICSLQKPMRWQCIRRKWGRGVKILRRRKNQKSGRCTFHPGRDRSVWCENRFFNGINVQKNLSQSAYQKKKSIFLKSMVLKITSVQVLSPSPKITRLTSWSVYILGLVHLSKMFEY